MAMDNFTASDLLRRVDNLVRLGTVLAVQLNPPRVQLQSGGIQTQWLPWLTTRAGTTRDWDPPTVGEQAVLLCPAGEIASGVVLVGLNTQAHPAPSSQAGECTRVYPDGARITYQHDTGTLTVTGIKTAKIQASQSCTVDCPSTTITGDVLIQGKLTVAGLLTYQAGLAGSGGGAGTVISGSITQTGGSLSSNGVVLDQHTHANPEGGKVGAPT